MHTDPATTCDNSTAAVLVTDIAERTLLVDRATHPHGWAPPGGHVFEHTNPADVNFDIAFMSAAVRETREETGVTPDHTRLRMVYDRWVDNRCRRRIADHGRAGHHWRVFATDAFTGTASDHSPEVHNVAWIGETDIEAMAHRTARYVAGLVDLNSWRSNPGLEPVWVWHLHTLGRLPNISPADALACLKSAEQEPK